MQVLTAICSLATTEETETAAATEIETGHAGDLAHLHTEVHVATTTETHTLRVVDTEKEKGRTVSETEKGEEGVNANGIGTEPPGAEMDLEETMAHRAEIATETSLTIAAEVEPGAVVENNSSPDAVRHHHANPKNRLLISPKSHLSCRRDVA